MRTDNGVLSPFENDEIKRAGQEKPPEGEGGVFRKTKRVGKKEKRKWHLVHVGWFGGSGKILIAGEVLGKCHKNQPPSACLDANKPRHNERTPSQKKKVGGDVHCPEEERKGVSENPNCLPFTWPVPILPKRIWCHHG